MLLKKIILSNFRNFVKEEFILSPYLTIIIGANALGKTNLLESIFFLVNGVGFRESREVELLNYNHPQKTAFVEGVFNLGDSKLDFKIGLIQKDSLLQKKFFINKTTKKHFQYAHEQTKVVLFTPQQIEMLTGAPQLRRDYFNKLLCLFDFEYKRRLTNYEQGIRRRNKLLEKHKLESQLKEEIKFWDDYLLEQANFIFGKRQEYVDFLNQNNSLEKKLFETKYLSNEFTREKLERIWPIEVKVRKTLIGPQKDDFQIFIRDENEQKDVHHFASRSEQRLTILWLKINEITYFEKFTNRKPILLFDDIFSELDIKNKKLVFGLIQKYQTIATTTEIEVLHLADVPKSIIKL